MKLLKCMLKPLVYLLRRIQKVLFNASMKDIDKSIERWTWERYKRIKSDIERSNQLVNATTLNKVVSGEKIKVGILFQIPSAWASVESVWHALICDCRFETKVYIYDAEQKEKAQMAGARDFLKEHNIPYVVVDNYTLADDPPHILFYQTPWDDAHRPKWLQSDTVSKLGIRIAYIPYGLNYSASVWKDYVFSDLKLHAYPWRIFTYSNRMRFDHICLSPRGGDNVVALGHPKFDSLVDKKSFKLEEDVRLRINGRKVVLIQMHFAATDGNNAIPEADIHSYIEFLKNANRYPNLFFLLRPHPKMLEMYHKKGMDDVVEEFTALLELHENVCSYDYPDYRPALFAADAVVGDRSALLIEAGALRIPVLYMTNYYYKETMLPAIAPLFDSYYQGSFSYDIERFVEMVILKGLDYKKSMREDALKICLPEIDGKCGLRIVNYIADEIVNERN